MSEEEIRKYDVVCNGCGAVIDHTYVKECQHCGNTKCVNCDMGDDVECPNCPEWLNAYSG